MKHGWGHGWGNTWWAPILLILGAGSFWLPRPWCVLLWCVMAPGLATVTRRRERLIAVAALQRHRHRTANQLQLVGGWLEMDNAQLVIEHLERMLADIADEGAREASVSPMWAYVIWVADGQAETRGTRCLWQVRGGCPRFPWDRWIFEHAFLDALKAARGMMTVRLYADGFCIELDHPLHRPAGGWPWVKVQEAGHTFTLIRGRLTVGSKPDVTARL